MHHLFARCYCLHSADFIRYCDNFIKSGEIRLLPSDRENGEVMETGSGFETLLH